jgi:hypothetical protein
MSRTPLKIKRPTATLWQNSVQQVLQALNIPFQTQLNCFAGEVFPIILDELFEQSSELIFRSG